MPISPESLLRNIADRMLIASVSREYFWPVLTLVLVVALPVNAQLTSERCAELVNFFKKGEQKSHREIYDVVTGIESIVRRSDDAAKQVASTQAVQMAAAILSTRDLTLSLEEDVGTWPKYDGTEFGGKPLWSGVDPNSIKDPRVKARYIQVLEEHRKKLARVYTELKKIEAADYAAEFALDMIEAAQNKNQVAEAASAAIEALPEAPWIKAHIRGKLFPQAAPSESEAPVKSSPQVAPKPGPVQTNAPVITLPGTRSLPNTIKQTKPESRTTVTPSEQIRPAGSVALWIVGAITVMILLSVLIWFLRKK